MGHSLLLVLAVAESVLLLVLLRSIGLSSSMLEELLPSPSFKSFGRFNTQLLKHLLSEWYLNISLRLMRCITAWSPNFLCSLVI